MKKSNSLSVEKEKAFRVALDKFRKDPNNRYYRDQLWFIIYEACQANTKSYIKKKQLHGERLLSDMMDRCLDATIDTFRKITEPGYEVNTTLITYSRNWTNYHLMWNPVNKAQDQELQLNAFLDDFDDKDHYEPYVESFEDELVERLSHSHTSS